MEVVVDDGQCQLVIENELRHLPAYQNGMVQLLTEFGCMLSQDRWTRSLSDRHFMAVRWRVVTHSVLSSTEWPLQADFP